MKGSIYTCSKCDAQSPKWSGRCFECGAWGTLDPAGQPAKSAPKMKKSNSAPGEVMNFSQLSAVSLERISAHGSPAATIFPHGIPLGSLTLLAGQPGAGKSTIALQIALQFSQQSQVLYFSAEESASQVREKIERLGHPSETFLFSSEQNLEKIIATIDAHSAKLVVVDSIQTIHSDEVDSEMGSVTQLKACTAQLLEAAKAANVAIILIGHVTKEGAVAGPKTLEHLVDIVLYLEGQRESQFRIIRSTKNRYGTSGTVAVFQMTGKGLLEVRKPATAFIANFTPKPGSVIGMVADGGQVFFIEVQSLVTKSSYGYAKRTAQGYPVKRVEVLLAVMKKRLHLNFDSYDVYVNLVGGMSQKDPSLDVAICLSLISSLKNSILSDKTVVFGEIGLSAELRVVKDMGLRFRSAAAHGFSRVISPPLEKKIAASQSTKILTYDDLEGVIAYLGW